MYKFCNEVISMENIQESQNATVITGNTKLMMRIAGVLFAMLVAVQIIYNLDVSIINVFADHNNYIYLRHYIDLALFVSEILFSMACIIQKKSFFLISSVIITGVYLLRIVNRIIHTIGKYDLLISNNTYLDAVNYIFNLDNLCLAVSFIIIFLLFLAQQKNNRKLITVGKCVFVIPLIAYIVLHYKHLIYIYYFFHEWLEYGYFDFGLLLGYFQQILLIAAILLLSLSLIITPKELNVPASSTAYGKSYKSLVPHVLLLLFTCGIYYLVWIYRTTDSLNACKNEEYRTPINKLLLCMFVPFYSIYWTYKSAHRIDTLGYEKGIQGDTATLSLILLLFVPILPPILMQSKLNSVIMADSVSPAVATAMQYAAKPVDNGYNDLEKLKELYDKGVITEEEFTEKKKQVLGI
mgnify:CR=1 FL=1